MPLSFRRCESLLLEELERLLNDDLFAYRGSHESQKPGGDLCRAADLASCSDARDN